LYNSSDFVNFWKILENFSNFYSSNFRKFQKKWKIIVLIRTWTPPSTPVSRSFHFSTYRLPLFDIYKSYSDIFWHFLLRKIKHLRYGKNSFFFFP
jgi:hypothetical protein